MKVTAAANSPVTPSHAGRSSSHRFEVPVSVSLAVDVGHGRHDLSEKHAGLLLRQTVLSNDVIEQLPAWTVLTQRSAVFKKIHSSLSHKLYVHLPPES